MLVGILNKQPIDRLDIDLDFSDWLADRPGDEIASAVAEVDVAGLTVDSPPPVVASPVVKVWIQDGADGEVYKISLTATTAQGRVKQVEVRVRVRDV